MFEARLVQGRLLKTVLETVKDLMMVATLDCTEEGIQLQAMDNWHVSLLTVNIRADSFDKFRCDRTISVSVNLVKMYKIIRYLDSEDTLTIKVEDEAEAVTFTFEGPNRWKVSDCKLKVTKLDREHLLCSDQDALWRIPEGCQGPLSIWQVVGDQMHQGGCQVLCRRRLWDRQHYAHPDCQCGQGGEGGHH